MKTSRTLLLGVVFTILNSRMPAGEDVRLSKPIVLPPFLVEDHRGSSLTGGTDWLYSQDDGLEILSACPEDETEQFILELYKQRVGLDQFIPGNLLLQTSLPTTLILFPKSQKTEVDEQMVKEVGRIPSAANSSGRFSPMNDLRLSDPDSSFIFVVLDDWQWGWDIRHGYPKGKGSALFYSPAYLKFLIGSRVPVLPDWFRIGMTRLYESMAVKNPGTGSIGSAWTMPVVSPDNPWENSEFQRDPWISPGSAEALREHPESPRPLLSMRELFVPVLAPGRSEIYRRIWESQAELFVRWAFSGKIKDGNARLIKFVEAAATQPVTENLFQSCFGMRYSDARDALSDFLPEAVSKELRFAFAAAPTVSKSINLRAASPVEIHRIKGEWARRTLRVVQSSYPEALPLYVAKARSVLQGAYDRGERDPLLLASLALYRFDIGDAKGARQVLEEFPAAFAARPLAGLDLAQLSIKEGIEYPAGAGGTLSEKQAEEVLHDVSMALGNQPPLEAAFLVAAKVSIHLGRDPTEGNGSASLKVHASFRGTHNWSRNAYRGKLRARLCNSQSA